MDALEDTFRLAAEFLQAVLDEINELGEVPSSETFIYRTYESATRGSYNTARTIDPGLVREIVVEQFLRYRESGRLEELEHVQLIRTEEALNPHITKIGWLVFRYLEQATYEPNEDGISHKLPLQIDEDLFRSIWSGLIPFLQPQQIHYRVIYAIFHADLRSGFAVLPIQNPTWEQKSSFTESLRVRNLDLSGLLGSAEVLNWVEDCFAWFEHELVVPSVKANWPEHIGSLPDPLFYQEVLWLLGFQEARVQALFLPSRPYWREQSIDFFGGRISTGGGVGSIGFPDWTKLSLRSRPDQSIDLEKTEAELIASWPEHRRHMKGDDRISMLLTRFRRTVEPRFFNEGMLETVIGLESVLTRGNTEANLQFRTNGAWLLGQTYEQRLYLEDILKDFYNIRSALVHSGGLSRKNQKRIEELGGFGRCLQLAQSLFRLAILRFIDLENGFMGFHDPERFIDYYEMNRLGGEEVLPTNDLYEKHSHIFWETFAKLDTDS